MATMAQPVGDGSSALAATFVHELRTPLQAVLGFAEMLQAGVLTGADREECLRRLIEATRHVASLLDDAPSADPAASVPTVVAESISLASGIARERDVRLRTAAAGKEHYVVRADRCQLRQAVLNLLTNAIKNSPPGAEVVVELRRAAASVRIAVRDSGPGLSAADIARLLDPQDEPVLSRNGLGLRITRRLVDAMDGRLGAYSEPGAGACFWLDIPMIASIGRSSSRALQ
jgi:signal transduction histidine kinase